MGEGAPTVLDGRENLSGTGCEGVGIMQSLLLGLVPPGLPKNTGNFIACFWVLQQGIALAWDNQRLPMLV